MIKKKQKAKAKPITKPGKKSIKTLDPAHLDWLVSNRAATQHTSVRLFQLLKEHPKELKGSDFASPAQMLVAISFSLWRSVFLSDKTNKRKDTNNDAFAFLGDMILTNAVVFTNERNTKNWTFNYYAGNAFYRLRVLSKNWNRNLGPLLPPAGAKTPKNRWSALQSAFEKAVDHFEHRLKKGEK